MELLNERVKIVWQDGLETKATFGILEAEDDLFFSVRSDNSELHKISKRFVVSISQKGAANG